MADPQQKRPTDVLSWDDAPAAAPAAPAAAPAKRATDVLDYGPETPSRADAQSTAKPTSGLDKVAATMDEQIATPNPYTLGSDKPFYYPTMHGMYEIGRGVTQGLRGVVGLAQSARDSWSNGKAQSPSDVMMDPIAKLPAQTKAVIANPPTLGEIGDVSGQTAGNLAPMLATSDAVRPLMRGVRGMAAEMSGVRPAVRAFNEAVRGPVPEPTPTPTATNAEVATPDVYRAGYRAPRAYPAQTAAPVGPRPVMQLPGEVSNATADLYNVDPLRARLTSPEAIMARGGHESAGLGGMQPPEGVVPVRDPLRNFMTENPSALGRLPKPGPTALDRFVSSNPSALAGIKPSATKGVSEPPEGATTPPKAPEGIAKPETPPAKPVAPAKGTPEKPPQTRAVEHRMGEFASKFDEDNLQHQKIYNYTNDRLAEEANKAKIDGKTDWTERDISKAKGGGGKAAYVRGKLMDAASGSKGKGGNVLGASNDVEAINKASRANKLAKGEARAAAREAEKPFDPFDEMAAYQPGRSVHDVMGLRGGVPKK